MMTVVEFLKCFNRFLYVSHPIKVFRKEEGSKGLKPIWTSEVLLTFSEQISHSTTEIKIIGVMERVLGL